MRAVLTTLWVCAGFGWPVVGALVWGWPYYDHPREIAEDPNRVWWHDRLSIAIFAGAVVWNIAAFRMVRSAGAGGSTHWGLFGAACFGLMFTLLVGAVIGLFGFWAHYGAGVSGF